MPAVGSQNRAVAGQSAEVTHCTQACWTGSHFDVEPEQSQSPVQPAQNQTGPRQYGVAPPQVWLSSPQT